MKIKDIQCEKCNSKDFDYNSIDFDAEEIIFYCFCKKCYARFYLHISDIDRIESSEDFDKKA